MEKTVEPAKIGIKESKELISGAFEITKVVAVELRDGFQVQDIIDAFIAVKADPVREAKVLAALKDINLVKGELSDIDLGEGIELGLHAAKEVPALLEAFKKPE